MSSHRTGGRGAPFGLGVIAVVTTAVIGTSATASGAADGSVEAAGAAVVGGQYVISFSGDPDAAVAATRAAGGTVEDVTAEVGVLLVTAEDESFLSDVLAQRGIEGAARNHAVGTTTPGMPHRFAETRPEAGERMRSQGTAADAEARTRRGEPLAPRQWNMRMIDATPAGAHRTETGKGVDVGIMDTGIDGKHPDLARNFDRTRSRNFTRDIPDVDGPCEYENCKDPANVDDNGHGTHVAGIVAAARNRFGIAGVAPGATLVNVRAGQDSGFFFLYETVKALVYSGRIRLDVVNMSFYTDPWMYNCTSRDEYVTGTVTRRELAEQRLIRRAVLNAVSYAHRRGVTLVGAAGNEFTNLAAPTRFDPTSPDYPLGSERERTVENTCLNLPSEAPQVISVSAVGPSTTKSDYSNYGLGDIDIAAPGGWYRDRVGTSRFQTPGNLVLSSIPRHVALEAGWIDARGNPQDEFTVRYCSPRGVCGFYSWFQGTSMASPHVAGVAALVIGAKGRPTGDGGRALAPRTVRRVLLQTAEDHRCPRGGVEVYTDEGRTADWNAVCRGTTDRNGLYGEGIVDALAAVRSHR